jgi:YgiT-type zinc finger domain-containing protein
LFSNVICKLKFDFIYEKRLDKAIKALEGITPMSIKNGSTCPVCGQGRIYKEFKQEEFEYKGQKLTLENYPVFICDACGEEFVTAEDAKQFDDEETRFHDKVNSDSQVMQKWIAESERRYQAYTKGNIASLSLSDIKRRYEKSD